MKKIAIIQLIVACSPLLSMETGVSYKETGSWKNLYDREVVAVASSGTVMIASDEKNGPFIVTVENNKAQEGATQYKASDVFSRSQSGAHAAFSPSGALCAAILCYPRTSRPHSLALFDTKTGAALALDEAVAVSGTSWESGKYCNPLIWLTDEMLAVFSSGDVSKEAQQKISSSLKSIKNKLTLYRLVREGSEFGLFSEGVTNFDGMLLRAAHSLGKGSLLVVHDDEKEGEMRSAIRLFAPSEESETFGSHTFIFPARFSTMGRVHIAPIAEKKMVAVGASTEPTIYLLDTENVSCLAKLTLTEQLITLCASPLKPYLFLVTEPTTTATFPLQTVALLACDEPKKAKIVMSDECIDGKDSVSFAVWAPSNEILMKKDSGLYGVAANVLMTQKSKKNKLMRNNSSKKNLVEKLRGSFSKLFN